MKRFDTFTIRRAPFWAGYFGVAVLLALMLTATPQSGSPAFDGAGIAGMFLGFSLSLIALVALIIARVRDSGLSPWYALLVLVPFGIGQIATIYFGCIRSDDDPKKGVRDHE